MKPMFEVVGRLSTYEEASLEMQRASLDIQQANLDIQQANLVAQQSGNEIVFWIGITQAAVALLVGLIQAGVVGWGIRYMIRMGERREQQHADRHAETMEALRQQGEATREALRQQGEALRQQGEATREALRQQGEALRTLIERTAPAR